MAVDLMWLVPGRVIYARCYGEFGIDDLQTLLTPHAELIEQGTPLVHSVPDATNVEKMNFGINDLRDIFLNKVPPSQKRGWLISVTPSAIQRFMGSLAAQFSNIRQRQTSVIEEALTFLAGNDDSLPSYEEMMDAYHQIKQQASSDRSVGSPR